MSVKHILLKKAFIYQSKSQNTEIKNYVYDYSLGYWVKKNTSMPAVYDYKFSKPKTKKEDIETGEDQKGA